ncbi:hypothetical protein ACP4OV_002215 [Aristida adscensionis]
MELQFGAGAMPQLQMLHLESLHPSRTMSTYGDFVTMLECRTWRLQRLPSETKLSRIPNKPLLELGRESEYAMKNSDDITDDVPVPIPDKPVFTRKGEVLGKIDKTKSKPTLPDKVKLQDTLWRYPQWEEDVHFSPKKAKIRDGSMTGSTYLVETDESNQC